MSDREILTATDIEGDGTGDALPDVDEENYPADSVVVAVGGQEVDDDELAERAKDIVTDDPADTDE